MLNGQIKLKCPIYTLHNLVFKTVSVPLILAVKIPYLGTFYLSVRVKSAATKAEFVDNFNKNLRNITIRFLPDPELKEKIAKTAINTMVEGR